MVNFIKTNVKSMPVGLECFAPCDYCTNETEPANRMRDRYLCSTRGLDHCNVMLYVFIRPECANAKHDWQIPRVTQTGLRITIAPCRDNFGRLCNPLFLLSHAVTV